MRRKLKDLVFVKLPKVGERVTKQKGEFADLMDEAQYREYTKKQ